MTKNKKKKLLRVLPNKFTCALAIGLAAANRTRALTDHLALTFTSWTAQCGKEYANALETDYCHGLV